MRRLAHASLALALTLCTAAAAASAADRQAPAETISVVTLGSPGSSWTMATSRGADGTVRSWTTSEMGTWYGDGYVVGRSGTGSSATVWTSARTGSDWRGGLSTGRVVTQRAVGASETIWVASSTGAMWGPGVASTTVRTEHVGQGGHDAGFVSLDRVELLVSGWVGFRGFVPFAHPVRFGVVAPLVRPVVRHDGEVVIRPRDPHAAEVALSTALPRVGRLPVYFGSRVLIADPATAARVRPRHH